MSLLGQVTGHRQPVTLDIFWKALGRRMDVLLPKFGNRESDAEQSHSSWHVCLLRADSSSRRAGCFEMQWWLCQMDLGRFLSGFQVQG